MAKVTLKKDGTIELKRGAFAPRIIGEWMKQDVWNENGGRYDESGNKLVHIIYHATLRKGTWLQAFTRNELVQAIKNYY